MCYSSNELEQGYGCVNAINEFLNLTIGRVAGGLGSDEVSMKNNGEFPYVKNSIRPDMQK